MRWILLACLLLSPAAFAAELDTSVSPCYDFTRDGQGDVIGAVAVSCDSAPPPPPPPPSGNQLAMPSAGLYPRCDDPSQSVSFTPFVAPAGGNDHHQVPGVSLDIDGDGAYDEQFDDYASVTTAPGWGNWVHLLDVAQSQAWVARTYSAMMEEVTANGATFWCEPGAIIDVDNLYLRSGSSSMWVCPGATMQGTFRHQGGSHYIHMGGVNGGAACAF